ncbi:MULTISPECIES: DUF4145 domain-containing protein [unclassified Variovorax]|uniref:DUF4145 domain-containing protein n=1 Tax=unclassified Variovorax TaxID=663243 RepID=UPI001317B693|nr:MULTISPECIES: DUF4145 domain-containing protein [unclassified Variovorax]VTU42599.1 hypothetical protein H6P1_00231 [Variovorax sp. PBL-H6]VTU43817.1 hypothetical protein SRS16P1_00672 [Variovorax sp. SRS16]VTU43882.1 hypothetical protein E5P1_00665 [Variovorax sp. PBL-E5]
MSDIELVITWSRRLEKLLATRYGARGKGLHALTTAARHRLPPNTEPGLRWIATMRNKVLHDDGFRLGSRRDFAKESRRLQRALGSAGTGLLAKARAVVVLGLFLAGIWGFSRGFY